uniref:Uncharacterized protein n=1 Tax=Romanomermis culicivorax TaxID=13658 RepID=A0A915KL11_ROMCU
MERKLAPLSRLNCETTKSMPIRHKLGRKPKSININKAPITRLSLEIGVVDGALLSLLEHSDPMIQGSISDYNKNTSRLMIFIQTINIIKPDCKKNSTADVPMIKPELKTPLNYAITPKLLQAELACAAK